MKLQLKTRVIQAPMAGCTDLAFRLLAREYGMEFAFLEMVSSEALVRKNRKTQELLATHPQDKPLGAQLVGARPDIMAEAALMLEAMGFDAIDINCGCPVPKITSPGAGSALLLAPQKSKQIFEAVIKKVKKIPVTVKMRTGYRDPSGKEALLLAQLAQDAGCHGVTIHARTRDQGYRGKADWTVIKKIKQVLKIPVIGNGDIDCGMDAKKMMETTGCDAVMVGRGALGNPWIYRSIESALKGSKPYIPNLKEKKNVLLRHLQYQLQYTHEKVAILRFRKIAAWYLKNISGCAKLRAKINTLSRPEEMRQAIMEFGVSAQASGR